MNPTRVSMPQRPLSPSRTFGSVSPRPRLDQALVERGLCDSREQAKRAIMAGRVKINRQPARKPSDPVGPDDRIELEAGEKYVSRGGYKLEHALTCFQLNVEGWVVIDLGASTGGFTDCLLQRGAEKVFAIDVGRGQLAWKLRRHPRVVVMERTNARDLTQASFPAPFRPTKATIVLIPTCRSTPQRTWMRP